MKLLPSRRIPHTMSLHANCRVYMMQISTQAMMWPQNHWLSVRSTFITLHSIFINVTKVSQQCCNSIYYILNQSHLRQVETTTGIWARPKTTREIIIADGKAMPHLTRWGITLPSAMISLNLQTFGSLDTKVEQCHQKCNATTILTWLYSFWKSNKSTKKNEAE